MPRSELHAGMGAARVGDGSSTAAGCRQRWKTVETAAACPAKVLLPSLHDRGHPSAGPAVCELSVDSSALLPPRLVRRGRAVGPHGAPLAPVGARRAAAIDHSRLAGLRCPPQVLRRKRAADGAHLAPARHGRARQGAVRAQHGPAPVVRVLGGWCNGGAAVEGGRAARCRPPRPPACRRRRSILAFRNSIVFHSLDKMTR